MEFVEILGTPNMSLDGIMILVVEGEGINAGTLDDAIDLSGLSIPADGYFVAGTTAVANLDLDIGSDNVLENGTETFYLISTTDVSAIGALLGTNDDVDMESVTDISTMAGVTIVDMVDADPGDQTYDGPQSIGPDGSFFPAEIFRDTDYPRGGCGHQFLDFGLTTDRTPGAQNVICAISSGGSFCDGSSGNCPCGATGSLGQGCPNSDNSNGAKMAFTGSADLTGSSFGLAITDSANMKFGIFIQGPSAISYPNGNSMIPNSSGLFCVAPTLRGAPFITDAFGNATVTDFQGSPFSATAQSGGSITYYQ